MTTKLISQSTSERKQETEDLFNEVQSLLDDGLSLRQAVIRVKNLSKKRNVNQCAWYRDLKEYAKTKGY